MENNLEEKLLQLEPHSSNDISKIDDGTGPMMDGNQDDFCSPVIKNATSDNSDGLSANDKQNNLNSVNSQFYESSDSKIDYAEKLDDNDTLSDIDDIKTDTASADSEDSALGSLPSDAALNDREDDGQDRSDGSDSGLGSETTEDMKLLHDKSTQPSGSGQNNILTLSENMLNNTNITSDIGLKVTTEDKWLRKSNLKRRCDDENSSSPQTKRRKEKSIQFNNVTVHYFPRAQGFTCVPSQGGSTLGMEREHSHTQKFSLAEHALEQRRLHRQILQQLKSERHAEQGVPLSSSEDSDTEEETSDISESELDLDSYYFLQPVPTKQRRALLRAAGVRKIEAYEKDECRDIRTSREFCGCACKGICNPEICSCSLAGIKCQVDRLNFPCGCTRDGCGNTTGRIEFNPIRVRTHFINTLVRIGLEKKNEQHHDVTKRQWVDAHNINSTMSCVPNTTPYEKEKNHSSPGLSTQSCVSNNDDFHNVLCNINNSSIPINIKGESSYTFPSDTISHGDNLNIINYEDKVDHRNHDPYTSSILQGKGPPYPSSSRMEFNTIPSSIQRYPCDLNYVNDQQSNNHQYKGLQSYSASSFEEFAHSSHLSMFNHYGHMYVSDYGHKQPPIITEHNTLQYHPLPQNHYDMYKTSPENVENKSEPQYTSLMTMPYQQCNKLHTVENDENWFSHNTLLNLDTNSDQISQSTANLQNDAIQTPADDASDTTENLGELIKKTMVESVTV